MQIKLAYRNVKRNKTTYAIYFFTLVVIYALVYSFYGILEHPVFGSLVGAQAMIGKILNQYIKIMSFLVAIVLAFLVLYVSDFVMKRRRRELGLYASLGMRNSRISKIISTEVGLVNTGALVWGLIVGQLFSAGLAVFANKLFDLHYTGKLYNFSLSAVKLVGLIFLVVLILIAIFNSFKLRKIRIIGFINDRNKEVTVKDKNSKLNYTLFVLSILVMLILVVFAFRVENILDYRKYFNWFIVALVVASIMFYYSISSALIQMAKKNKGFYYKGHNTVSIRQTSQNLGKNIVAMSILSLALSLAMSLAVSSISNAKAINKSVEDAAPFDVAIYRDLVDPYGNQQEQVDLEKEFKDGSGLGSDELTPGVSAMRYKGDITYGDVLDCSNLWRTDEELPETELLVMSISDYNAILEFQGANPIELEEDEYFINCNYDGTIEQIKDFINKDEKLNLNGYELSLKTAEPLQSYIYFLSTSGNNDRGTFVVSDEVAKSLKLYDQLYVCDIKGGIDHYEIDNQLQKWVDEFSVNITLNDEMIEWFPYTYVTKRHMSNLNNGYSGVIIFVMIYLCIVMMVASVSILAIQIIAEVLVQIPDYKILKSLGSNQKSVNNLISKQIVAYFLAPMLLALPFSYVGSKLIISIFEDYFRLEIAVNWQYSLVIFVILVIYSLISYQISKKSVEADLK